MRQIVTSYSCRSVVILDSLLYSFLVCLNGKLNQTLTGAQGAERSGRLLLKLITALIVRRLHLWNFDGRISEIAYNYILIKSKSETLFPDGAKLKLLVKKERKIRKAEKGKKLEKAKYK